MIGSGQFVALPVFVTGGGGQIATELARAGHRKAIPVTVTTRSELDITSRDEIHQHISRLAPGIVVNAAAYTAVDRAESEPTAAFAANRDGPGHLAEACALRGIPLIHISTDYVFDGEKDGAYLEDDPLCPLGVYGASKAEGEAMVRERLDTHVILRTAWVYSAQGNNFVRTMLRLGAEREVLSIVADQRGCPTAAHDIADTVLAIAAALVSDRAGYGTYHYTGAGVTTWFEFAEEIFCLAEPSLGRRPKLSAITTTDHPTPAHRPRNSHLDCSKIEARFGISPRPWRESLARVIRELAAATPRRRASR